MWVLCSVRTDRFPVFYMLVLECVRMKKFQPFQNSASVSGESRCVRTWQWIAFWALVVGLVGGWEGGGGEGRN